MLPDSLRRYFWEHDIKNIDEYKHASFIIERLLEHGNDDAILWLLRSYPSDKIITVVKKGRSLSRKTANFWKNFYSLREDEVYCLQKSYQNTDLLYWPG
jgi:hypothetical protein